MSPGPDNLNSSSGSGSGDDLSKYLQIFIDESAEELEGLVEAILQLEQDPRNSESLNKAFRMLHSLKGSCGMMGFEVVAGLAHELEGRFERYRSGKALLDPRATTVILQCVDFMNAFVNRLRTGDASQGDAAGLLSRLAELNNPPRPPTPAASPAPASGTPAAPRGDSPAPAMSIGGGLLVRIKFRAGLQLADLKARLIVSRLSAIGEVVACEPPVDDIHSFEELALFSLTLVTDRSRDEVQRIANVDGVETIEFGGGVEIPVPQPAPVVSTPAATVEDLPRELAESAPDIANTIADVRVPTPSSADGDEAPAAGRGAVGETLRVDVDRLDRLMNLTGELVIANARFTQISSNLSPVFRRNAVVNRTRDLTDRLRQRFQIAKRQLEDDRAAADAWKGVFDGLDDDLEALDEQSAVWDDSHAHFQEITEAVDQLTRVSKNLQKGVLNTRMVPVGPLFNRFKRVIRDLSTDRGKRVQLSILGEKTELDKRMVDALADPLLHLVRNSLDHGLETPAQRRAAGKPEVGTITLEATQRGNNVLITVRDDGGGINAEKIRTKIVARGWASETQVREMTEQQVIDHIWHPGFSTADEITEISGRGVGMDIVRNAIAGLSGTIDVAGDLGAGATFTIRLPLTLAIIHSLLIRFREGYFSVPIDDVREIVSVTRDQVHAVHRHQTIDVRGELIPLVSMDHTFEWNATGDAGAGDAADVAESSPALNVVVLHARNRTLGLRVDALVGRADIVIKSLSENFMAIRGLSGASIMGDGSVCLMLDAAALIELASERAMKKVKG